MSIAYQLSFVRGTLPEYVTLVAVSKTHPAGAIREAYDAGQLRNSILRYEYYEKLTRSTKTRFRYVSLATVLRSQSRLAVVPAF